MFWFKTTRIVNQSWWWKFFEWLMKWTHAMELESSNSTRKMMANWNFLRLPFSLLLRPNVRMVRIICKLRPSVYILWDFSRIVLVSRYQLPFTTSEILPALVKSHRFTSYVNINIQLPASKLIFFSLSTLDTSQMYHLFYSA